MEIYGYIARIIGRSSFLMRKDGIASSTRSIDGCCASSGRSTTKRGFGNEHTQSTDETQHQ